MDIWRRHHRFFCQITSEKRAQKFHTYDVTTQIWEVLLIS